MRNITLLLFFVWIFAAGEVLAQGNISNPSAARDYYRRGGQREHAKQLAEALADYAKAGELDPMMSEAHFARSAICAEMKDYRGAISALTACLKARPNGYSALFNRGLYHEYLKEYDDAIADYSLALAEDADFSNQVDTSQQCRAHAHHYRGRVYQWYKNDSKKAIIDYSDALRLYPAIEMVLYRRGQAHHTVKEYAKAHSDFERAVEQDPEYPNLLNSWAWQLATCPDAEFRDGKLAIEFAKKTKQLETLAAGYAETGNFVDAIAAQVRAIEQLEQVKDKTNAKAVEHRVKVQAEMEVRLETYRAKQPFREE
ncbi:MAG TPA: tetratricopeptide repeat protein [Schlesneria sp.]|jgi:tetratricopeptide (TPR) repeat protein